jgi:heme a synthase
MLVAMHTDVKSSQFISLVEEHSSGGLSWFSFLFACLVTGLILMGALVTSHDAGLTVPDWPTSYGENMFLFPPSKWVGGIFYEHVHRLYASVVGLLTVVLVVWTLLVEHRPKVRRLTLAALALVILQGLLGGATVIYQLPTAISSAHGVLGQTFLIVSVIIAYSHSTEFFRLKSESQLSDTKNASKALLNWSLVMVALVYVQLIVAAIMRHSGAGLAFIDFPTHAGRWIPAFGAEVLSKANQLRAIYGLAPIESAHLFVHALHRALAYLIVGLVYYISWSGMKSATLHPLLRSTLFIITVIVSLQLALGIATVASIRAPWVASFHVLGGALLLLTSVLLLLRTWVISKKSL